MKPIVAIVGRPNVGKSTLFNRLIKEKVSITYKEPGVTRDRVYRETSWMGKRFILVDTGGLIPSASDSLLQAIRSQVEVALNQADVILFMVDAKEGLSPLDEEIARLLYKRGCILVVNKMDTKEGKANLSDFYRLGIERIFPISAEHGSGVIELLEEIIERIPKPSEEEDKDIARFVILGRPNVGKSSLLNAILGEERVIVDKTPGTTREPVETSFTINGKKYRIVDTAGIRRKARVKAEVEYFSILRAIRNIERSDVALLMIDAKEGITTQDKKIASLVEDRGKGLVVIANKSDLLTKDELKNLRREFYLRAPFLNYVPVVLTSAINGRGIRETLRTVELVFSEANKRVDKSLLEDTILPEIEHYPSRLKVSSISQVGIRPPTFVLRVKGRDSISENYIKFIKNTLRKYFGFQGNPIRVRFKF